MGIKDKQTYGEYYWAMQLEAQKAFDEDIESVFAPYFRGIFADMPEIAELPAGMQTFIQALAEPPSAGFGGFALGVGVEMVDETLHSLLNPVMKMMSRSINRRALETWLTTAEANTLFRRGKIDETFWSLNVSSEGYDDIIAKFLYQAQAPYPTIPELVLYSRYHGDPDNVWTTIQDFYDVDAVDFKLWEWLGLQRLTTIQAQSLYKRGIITEYGFYGELARIGWAGDNFDHIENLSYILPNPMLLVQGGLMQEFEDTTILENISKGDIHPDYAKLYLDAVLTKPATGDIVAYELRQDPDLTNLPEQLRKIGIHPDYSALYKELAYQIPPVADIITMAVREAFTPDIAAKFGQYEDFPKPLEEWAAKKGLSAEWSQRYWAAHWNLPSPMQGFEMLHRGVINVDELNMLLRALDVMPFWRDKLTQIAYRRLTRVDIRRMYKTGVLTEKEVYESYLQHGYSEINAERMSEFTIRQTLATLSKFTSGDIVKAFTNRMIARSEAISLLGMIGISSEDSNFIVSTAEYKRTWAFTDQQISGIRNLYKKRVYDEDKTRDMLSKLNLPSDQINVLMQQWLYEKVEELDATWTTAQTLTFFKKGLITEERTRRELELNGYDTEHIDLYIRNSKWTPPTS